MRARDGPCVWEMSGGGSAGGSKVRSAVAVETERAAPDSVLALTRAAGRARVMAVGVEQGVLALSP